MRTSGRILVALALALSLAAASRAQVLEWARRYDGPGESIEVALATAVDDLGHVYVTGAAREFGGNPDYATVKYAPNGDTAWVRRWGGGPFELGWAVLPDPDGNVYVTGAPVTLKYGPDGDTLWVHENDAEFVSLAFDPVGNVVTAGTGFGDLRATKLRPDGVVVWEAVYDGPARFGDNGHDMVLDSGGNVVVAGRSWGLTAPGDGTQWNYAAVKFDGATGDTLWARHYNGPAAPADVPTDIAFAIAVDEADNVYVSGWSDGATRPGECHTIKYSAGGEVVWERRYAAGGACYDLLYDRGALYAMARQGDGDRLLKYDVDGNLLWVRHHAVEIGFATNDPRLAADAEGNVYLMSRASGGYAVVKYTAAGVRVWTFVYPGTSTPNAAYALAVDAEANVYVTGEGFSDYLTLKLSQEPVAAEPEPPDEPLGLGLPIPNPFAGVLTLDVSLGRPSPLRVEVFDALGRMVYEAHLASRPAGRSALTIDGSRWGPGVYLLHVTTSGGQSATRRAVRAR